MAWVYSRFAFRFVADRIRPKIKDTGIPELIDYAEASNLYTLDMKDIGLAELKKFQGAVQSVLEDFIASGDKASRDPQAIPGLLVAINELVSLTNLQIASVEASERNHQ
jgi:hypothetical protein